MGMSIAMVRATIARGVVDDPSRGESSLDEATMACYPLWGDALELPGRHDAFPKQANGAGRS